MRALRTAYTQARNAEQKISAGKDCGGYGIGGYIAFGSG